ncbi:MAG: crossover junction endodeoxyribonuclease RuvC [Candidatus Marinimicrobia bacterium]|jgi:crossover junction endodeoxyribonuclease RuvC|nr:crossover junction endodeoxyribonuclease RuvC [Candidatus Neomarinimicrobiota bacterium]MBT3617599.1 crossover junction endodeoxyribonuclease RuvC [Candidatus Neomarinimicrobiota bacterium]MBT3829816.1 crossover junction endodeoxyribonuclease RuvC [Candidatus Neomarinimicrobiota bacterium]MBT3996812.1 crossover junction endodeoxyribonuclease RuvC [Candidatus Neomarinimicrobiota bacterium]MBT4280069.1 crossover junction endodeoxyribonuclease RuvC [Candidatus Neomarinimicrobiota bacterium]
MQVIGIDPGLSATGYALLEENKGKVIAKMYGTITPPKGKTLADRLEYLFSKSTEIIKEIQPDVMAIEDTFFHKNFKSALMLGQARGVLILAAARMGIHCVEFAPKKVKMSVVGNGNASKEQVQYMVKQILKLKEMPKSLDISDAMAIGLCYINQNKYL